MGPRRDLFEWDIQSYVIKLRSGEKRLLLDNIGRLIHSYCIS